MTIPVKPFAATISAGMIALAFSGPALGGNYQGSDLPRSGGHIEAWYFPELETAEWSEFAAFETETIRSGSPESRTPWAAPGLPRSGGHIDAW